MSNFLDSAMLMFRRFRAEEVGATSVEYAFGMALLILVAVTALAILGNHVGSMTTSISTDLSSGTNEVSQSFGPGNLRMQTNLKVP